MTDPGGLTAEREGPHVRLTMSFPDTHDHAFMVERFDGMGEDADGNPVEVWTPIHNGTSKFVQGETDYELARPPDTLDGDWVPLPSPRTYRALAYRNAEPDSRVLILHTEGVYTEPVSI